MSDFPSQPIGPKNDLFRNMGFNDKNGNGIIEADKPEGYVKEADINGDGKIYRAECKYYLHNILRNLDKSLLQENPINEEDQIVITYLFKQNAEAILRLNTNDSNEFEALLEIAGKMGKGSNFAEAQTIYYKIYNKIKTQIDGSYGLALSLGKLAVSQVKNSMPLSDANNALEEAKENALKISNPFLRIEVLQKIAIEWAQGGRMTELSCKMLNEAFKVAQDIKGEDEPQYRKRKAGAEQSVAYVMAMLGFYDEALSAILEIDLIDVMNSDKDYRLEALYVVTSIIVGGHINLSQTGISSSDMKAYSFISMGNLDRLYDQLDSHDLLNEYHDNYILLRINERKLSEMIEGRQEVKRLLEIMQQGSKLKTFSEQEIQALFSKIIFISSISPTSSEVPLFKKYLA